MSKNLFYREPMYLKDGRLNKYSDGQFEWIIEEASRKRKLIVRAAKFSAMRLSLPYLGLIRSKHICRFNNFRFAGFRKLCNRKTKFDIVKISTYKCNNFADFTGKNCRYGDYQKPILHFDNTWLAMTAFVLIILFIVFFIACIVKNY